MVFPQVNSMIALNSLGFWILLLTAKHVMADFILQNRWMALGKEAPRGWALPLLVHCSIHGALAIGLILVFEPRFWFLGLADFVIHLAADRTKGFLTATFRLTPADAWFWWLLGIDQAIHHLTNFALAVILAFNG
jgi:hypothetical protein